MPPPDFIIVGAGYAGLPSAIELTRKGFHVEIFESTKEFTDQGDIIAMNASVTRVISNWGDCLEELENISAFGTQMTIFDWKGNRILDEPMDYSRDGYPFLIAPHGLLHLIIGFAIYRSFFDTGRLLDDPKTRHFAEGEGDGIYIWIGTDVHAVILPDKNLGKIGCFFTHRDEYNVEESWSAKGDISHLLKVIDRLDDTLHALFSKVPPEELFDWKLLWRDPLRSWVSPKTLIFAVGDSSHPQLPTSGSGAMQAIEDGATLGALADTLGMKSIPDLFKVFEVLRYERTNTTQCLGWENRYRLHRTDWEAVKKDPALAKPVHPELVITHDAEAYAYKNAEAALESVKSGTPFKSTNVPDGHVHQDWNVQTLMDLEA